MNKIPHAAREVGSFWWKDVLRLSSLYQTMSICTLGDGSMVLFWDDNWSGITLAENYSELLQFARNNQSSVRNVLDAQDLEYLFMLPLTENAYEELTSLQTFLQSVTYDEAAKDKWTMIWGSAYSSSKFYKTVFQSVDAHPIFKWVWKSKCTNRVKFFAWLVPVDRLNTRSMLKRRHLLGEDEVTCVMYTVGLEEDIDHLFFQCPFAQQCWQKNQCHLE
jgi:hypothetical protein